MESNELAADGLPEQSGSRDRASGESVEKVVDDNSAIKSFAAPRSASASSLLAARPIVASSREHVASDGSGLSSSD